MSFLSPSEPATLHSLAPSTSLNPQQLQQPRSQGGLLAPDQPRPESDGDAYIRDATPYMAFLDNNSNSCSSPIVRSGANSATGIMSGMEINNSSPQAGFASVNASGPSMAPNSSAQANNNVLAQFVQMPGNDQLLFEFDELSQYLAFDATHDSLNDMGDSSLYAANPATSHFDTSPTDSSIYSPLHLPSSVDYHNQQLRQQISTPRSIGANNVAMANVADLYAELDGEYFLANSHANSSSAMASGSGVGISNEGSDGLGGSGVGAWQNALMHPSHAEFSPGASQPSKDALLSPYYPPFTPSSGIPMPISTTAITNATLTLPEASTRPPALSHSRSGSDETRIHPGDVPMMLNTGTGNVGDETGIATGISPAELAGVGDLMHQRQHYQQMQLRSASRPRRPSLQRTSPHSRPQFVSNLWDTGANVGSTGPMRIPHTYSVNGKSPSPEPYSYSHSRSRSRSSLSPTLAPSSPHNRVYDSGLFPFPSPSSAPPQASVLRAAGRMRTYSQRGGADLLKAVASAKKEPHEYDFTTGVGMELDADFGADPDATIRKKKRTSSSDASTVFGDNTSPRSSVEPATKAEKAPLKSELKPPKLAPSTWQLYFTDWIQRHQLQSDKKLNVAQAAKEAGAEYASLTPEQKEPFRLRSLAAKEARERELSAWQRTLTPDAIKRENAFRAAQRKAGKSRRGNIKDPNAPKKPLSAYFMFLQHIRADPSLVNEVFGDERETTAQSVLAAAKWRSMTDEERKPFLAQAEKEKLEYEAARRLYEEGTVGIESTINFNINTDSDFSSGGAATTFVIARPASEQSSDSDADSEGFVTDEDRRLPNRV